jgi:hypothetical protein
MLRAPFQPGAALPTLASSKSKLWLLGALIVTALIAIPASWSAQLAFARMPNIAAPIAPPDPAAAPPPGMMPGPVEAPKASLLSIGGLINIAIVAGGAWLGWIVHALLAYFGGVLIGGRATFGGVFKTIALAAMPLALRGIVQLIYLATTSQPLGAAGLSGLVLPSAAVNINSNAAPITPPSAGTLLLGALLGGIDLFQIWALIALGLGLAALTRLKKGPALTLSVVTFVLMAILFALPSVISAVASAPAI